MSHFVTAIAIMFDQFTRPLSDKERTLMRQARGQKKLGADQRGPHIHFCHNPSRCQHCIRDAAATVAASRAQSQRRRQARRRQARRAATAATTAAATATATALTKFKDSIHNDISKLDKDLGGGDGDYRIYMHSGDLEHNFYGITIKMDAFLAEHPSLMTRIRSTTDGTYDKICSAEDKLLMKKIDNYMLLLREEEKHLDENG